MKKHNGMRPQDVVVLLKLAVLQGSSWLMKDLAQSLHISASEVSESLNRSMHAGLLASDKKKLMKGALLEFLEHGLKYVYPATPGAVVRGIPTAHSAPPLRQLISGNETYVWPDAKGNERGQMIEPLHTGVVAASLKDEKLYHLLALADALRIGKVREQQLAIKELRKRIE